MDIRLVVEAPVVGLVSFLSFVSPAAATYWGAEVAGLLGGAVGWLVSDLFVLAVLFPALDAFIDRVESGPPEAQPGQQSG